MPQYQLGRQPNDPRKARVRLAALPGATVVPPTSADWISGVAQNHWGVLGNDSVGDCTAAGAGHAVMMFDHYGQGHDVSLSDADALAMYEAVSGYTPSDPATDVGATLQDSLGYWRKQGIASHKIAAFAQIDPTNLPLVRACIAYFGPVYAGMNFPASAMDEFNAGQPWTTVAGSKIEGGHCIPIGAYDPTSFTCVTWGKPQPMTLDFYGRYVDEMWVPISLDWLSTQGTAPGGLNTDQLNADYLALTGQPGPFPHSNTPPPAPPQPAPKHDPADIAFAHASYVWRQAKGI